MPGKKKQYQFVVKRWESMIAHLHSYKDTQDPEDLHKFRVEIKKLKAFLVLYKKDISRKKLKPLRNLFKDSGGIRDAYIQLKLIEEYQPESGEAKREHQQLLMDQSQKFSSKIDRYIKDTQGLYTRILEQLHPVKKSDLLRMYKKQFRKIEQIFQQDDHATLHITRKRIKRLIYIYPLLGKKTKWNLNTGYLDKLQDTIGKWHDAMIAIPSLSANGLANEKITQQIRNRINKLEHAIHSLSKDFEHKVIS